MEADARARLGELGDERVHRLHHEMHVERQANVRLERRAHERADGQVRHVVVIHDVEVDEVGAGALHRAHSSPRREKSADRIEGAMRNVMAARSLQCRGGAGEALRVEVNAATSISPISPTRAPDATCSLRSRSTTRARSPRSSSAALDHHRRAGLVQEVRGLGVVGAQPLLQPGERFEYTSGASIATPVGTMRGSYQMVAADGTRFEAPIPEFTLSVPGCCTRLLAFSRPGEPHDESAIAEASAISR